MENKSIRVLFVSSGNIGEFDMVPFIKIQGDSIKAAGASLEYYAIREKGIRGYVKSIFALRKVLNKKKYDIIHAHYTLSGWPSVFAKFNKNIPMVLSLMGSDAYGDIVEENKRTLASYIPVILTFLIQPFVDKIISKSQNIEKYVHRKNKSVIIPNGINLELFDALLQKNELRKELNLKLDKKYILFLGEKETIRKNYNLAKQAVDLLDDDNVELINPYPIAHDLIPKYFDACDLLVFTSLAEGSPNVIKEAMACNIPIVSTDVGDVKWLIDGVEGCYLSSFIPNDVANKLKSALEYSGIFGRTKGRERIIDLGLDSKTVAEKIIKVYRSLLEK